jgi:transcriptional regulator with XRE-family HTH domain
MRKSDARGMNDFGRELARLMQARGIGVRELARAAYCNPGHISNLRSGKARPSPQLAETLDTREARCAGNALPSLDLS